MVERFLIEDRGRTASTILVGAGIAGDARVILGDTLHRRAAVFTQEPAGPIAERAADALRESGADVAVRVLPDRDGAKTLEVAGSCYRWLNGLGLTRDDLILGVGGGALTDIAGFVSATYLRGVRAVFVPTTLLGAVDAAIGGKTALNVDGKNLAGVFKHPDRVVVDTDVISELPAALLREGHAEAVKAGFISDTALIDIYEEYGAAAPIPEIVARAIAVKVAVVSEDFTERGSRAFLNYGHTVGHAVEVLAGISHGDAVAIGMTAAAAAGARVCGFPGEERQNRVVASLGLPVRAPRLDRDGVLQMMELDKKRDDRGLNMVLLEDFGKPIVVPVDAATVDAALRAIGLV